MAEVINNKEGKPLEYYAAKYRGTDPLQIAARTALPYDETRRVFTLTLMNSVYEVTYPEFSVRFLRGEGDRLSGYPVGQILILRFLTGGQFVRGSGQFLSYRDMPWGDVYFANFTNRCIRRLAFSFAGKEEAVARRMAALGGTPYENGDIGWEFPFMPGLLIRISIWDADEEFPPSAQILFSDNFQYAFDADDMAYTGDIFIKILSAVS